MIRLSQSRDHQATMFFIFFIEGIVFLLTFSTPINLLGVTALANRTVNTISKALDQHIANYRSHGFQVVEIFLDSESGLIALNETYQLRGVKFTYAPSGQHVPVIERKIRLVKERCRPLFSDLPCALCKQLLIALVKFAISRTCFHLSKTSPRRYRAAHLSTARLPSRASREQLTYTVFKTTY